MEAKEFEKYMSSMNTKKSPFFYTSRLMVAQKYLANGDKEIADKIGAYLGKNLASEQAIQWAMVMGHSTKLRDSGGLGLSIITELVRMNEGEFLLISGDGVLCMHGSESNYEKISGFFPGTFVNLVFDLSDPKKYMKTDENQSTVNFEWEQL